MNSKNIVKSIEPISNTNSDTIINPIHRDYSVIIGNAKTISDDILYYIIYNADSIINDKRIYDRYDNTLSTIITNRINSDSTFRNIYMHCVSMLKAPTISDTINSRQYTIDMYYRHLALEHINISNAINDSIPINRDSITTPTGRYSIDVNTLKHLMYKHKNIYNRYIGKTITYIDLPYDMVNGKKVTCSETTTTNVNTILYGRDVLDLYRSSESSSINSKSIKDIINRYCGDDWISTLRAMRIDNGIAPSCTWLGNSRDCMFIVNYDYDNTSYYCVYSTDVYSSDDIYDMIYGKYCGIYGSAHKYAMDTSFSKYCKVFNDADYIQYAFDIQRGIVDRYYKVPKIANSVNRKNTILRVVGGKVVECKVGMLNNSYNYDDEYYSYKPEYIPLWSTLSHILLGNSSNITYKSDTPNSCVRCTMRCNGKRYCLGAKYNYDICTNRYNNPIDKYSYETNIICNTNTFDISRYTTDVISSIQSASIDSIRHCTNIYHRAINMLNAYLPIDDDSVLCAIDAISRNYGKYASNINEYSIYNMVDNCFNPYTERMYKGRKGSNTIDIETIYNPTYRTSWKPMIYTTHRKVSTTPTNSNIWWYRTLRAIHIDGYGGICRSNDYEYSGGDYTTTTHSGYVPTLPTCKEIAISMRVSDVVYNRWASTTPNPTSPHIITIKSIDRNSSTVHREPKRSTMYSSTFKRRNRTSRKTTGSMYNYRIPNKVIYNYDSNSMSISDVVYNRWASTTSNPTSPHYDVYRTAIGDVTTIGVEYINGKVNNNRIVGIPYKEMIYLKSRNIENW